MWMVSSRRYTGIGCGEHQVFPSDINIKGLFDSTLNPINPSRIPPSSLSIHQSITNTNSRIPNTKYQTSSSSNMKSDPTYTTPFFINNVEVTSTKTFPVNNPTDNSLIWNASAATLEDVEKVAKAAAEAFPAWSRTKYTKRRELIHNFKRILKARQAELAECMTLETGATAFWGEANVSVGLDLLEHIAGTVVTISGSIEEESREGG